MVSKWLHYETSKIACSDPPKRAFILFHFHGSVCQEHLGYSTCLIYNLFLRQFLTPLKEDKSCYWHNYTSQLQVSLNVSGVPT